MVQEMRALSALEDVNDDDIFELSAMESGVRRVASSVDLLSESPAHPAF